MNQQQQKWLVLLFSLFELNGGSARNIVLQHINDCNYWYKNDSNDVLRQTRNEKAWRNDFSYERQHLVESGYMANAARGMWQITNEGKILLTNLINQATTYDQLRDSICYTSAFYNRIASNQNIVEAFEDEYLISQLANNNFVQTNTQSNLSNEPQPIGPKSNRHNDNQAYLRNPTTSKNALIRANNSCEIDRTHTSFLRRDENTMYMEPHHLIPMSLTNYFGVNLDREQNIFSLCSNCHNQIHYGAKEDVKK